ncbi:MAG: cysteine--tRNA ligase [Bacteroidota bacterium]
MGLHVYNTLTRKKEEFVPLRPGVVGMYVCGPTVYEHSHLGHAKSYLSFDVVVRYLRFLGYRVLYVQNITDVGHLSDDADMGEDRIERRSKVDRVHPMQLVETYTRSYFEDMDALGVLRPDISPRASGHIVEQIELAQTLLEKGHAYEANGSVYFDVSTFDRYGCLSGRTVDEMEAGVRIEVKTEKHHPADFALWKAAEPGHILRWPSPWGEGYPGWHLECSSMSMKYIGQSIDIHGGGLENQFPHHECEIAQSECATGSPFVKYWLHNNMVTVDGRKMGKSLNNYITLKDAFARWSPQVVRFFILQSHYRSTLDFSESAVLAAAKGFEKLQTAYHRIGDALKALHGKDQNAAELSLDRFRQAFNEAMDDDFNTPRAIAVLFDLTREINQVLDRGEAVSSGALAEVKALVDQLSGDVLGLDLGVVVVGGDALEMDLMDLLITLRQEIRAQKLWALSDSIRDRLGALGVSLEDTREGTTWKKGMLRSPGSSPPSNPPGPTSDRQSLKPELPKNVRKVFGEDGED